MAVVETEAEHSRYLDAGSPKPSRQQDQVALVD